MTHDTTLTDDDWQSFRDNIEAMEASVGLDFPDNVRQYLERARELAYRAGWSAGHRARPERSPAQAPAATVHVPQARSIKSLQPGESGWVLAHAIVEHGSTRKYFADPYFDVASDASAERMIHIAKTDRGLVATGPQNLHRISRDPPTGRLLPVVGFSMPTN